MRANSWRPSRGWLVLACLSTLLAACTAGETKPLPTSPSPTSTPSPTSPPRAEGPARLQGRVIAESDVGSQPDEPMTDQLVVAMPRAAVRELADSDQPLRFTTLHLDVLPDGTVTTLTDDEGRYRLTLDPGEYALCLAYPERSSQTDPPLLIRGCGALTLAPGTERTVDVSSGFGEIQLVEP